ncbi:MAG: Uma2 family endonuclease, partial [Chloroflexi bacterium]|nr:Uma2 family endonuclease [Chloroflexota bacterium]
ELRLRDSHFTVCNSDMRVEITEGRHVYPDLSVVRGQPQLEDDDTTLLNPIVTVEVLSTTSVAYDRYTKLEYYRALPSLEAYVIVDQFECYIDLHTRTETGWHWQSFSDLDDVIPLDMIGCQLPLSEVYRGIVFSED